MVGRGLALYSVKYGLDKIPKSYYVLSKRLLFPAKGKPERMPRRCEAERECTQPTTVTVLAIIYDRIGEVYVIRALLFRQFLPALPDPYRGPFKMLCEFLQRVDV